MSHEFVYVLQLGIRLVKDKSEQCFPRRQECFSFFVVLFQPRLTRFGGKKIYQRQLKINERCYNKDKHWLKFNQSY